MKKLLVWPLLILWHLSLFSSSYDEISTKHPLVLIHGLFGFSGEMPFSVQYWGHLPESLRLKGTKVLIASLSAINESDIRAKQLLGQLEEWGYEKYNLIGHSQGGLDARYILKLAPHKVASITTIGTPHLGSPVADAICLSLEAIPLIPNLVWGASNLFGHTIHLLSHYQTTIKDIKNLAYQVCQVTIKSIEKLHATCLPMITQKDLGKIITIINLSKESFQVILSCLLETGTYAYETTKNISAKLKYQDSKKAFQSLTTKALVDFNNHCPQGLKEEAPCKLYSFGTHSLSLHSQSDIAAYLMHCTGWLFFKHQKNDGLVSLDSMQFGEWLGELAGAHHVVATKNGIASFSKEQITWFEDMLVGLAKRLQEQGM